MPKQHNALYGDDLHNPKGMTVDSHASSSKFVISASNMTITASGFTVKAAAFQGDGSGITGVPANDWDGSHTGDGNITGTLTANEFVGGGAGITGITGEWDGSHTGTATFTGNVTASGVVSASGGFVGDGSNLTGVTAEWDGSHTGTAAFTGNVTASGVVSASGGFVGDGSNLSGISTDSFSDGTATLISGSSVSTGSFAKIHIADAEFLSMDHAAVRADDDIQFVGWTMTGSAAGMISGLQEDDLILYAYAGQSNATSATQFDSEGYSSLGATNNYDYYYGHVWYKKMGATPDTSIPVPTGNTFYYGDFIATAWRNVHPDDLWDASVQKYNGSNHRPNTPSITTVTAKAVVVSIGMCSGGSFTAGPSGYDGFVSSSASGRPYPGNIGIAYKEIATGASEDPGEFTSEVGNHLGYTIALKKYPAGTYTTNYGFSDIWNQHHKGTYTLVSGSSDSSFSGGTATFNTFVGDGSGITGVTGEWDGTHTGTATFTGNVTASGVVSASGGFVGDGSNLTGVTAEWDGSHTGTAAFTGNVTASGVVSASGGFVGDGSNLTGISTGVFSDGTATLISGSSVSTGSFDKLVFDGKELSASYEYVAPGSFISYVGSCYSTGNTVATLPAGVEEGDLVLYCWYHGKSGQLYSQSTAQQEMVYFSSGSYTFLENGNYSGDVNMGAVLWGRIQPAIVDTVIPGSGMTSGAVAAHVFRGIDTSTYEDVAIAESIWGNSTTPNAPDITTTTDNTAIISMMSVHNMYPTHGPTDASSTPDGYSSLIRHDPPAYNTDHGMSYLLDSGDAGEKIVGSWGMTSTGGTLRNISFTVALRRASGGDTVKHFRLADLLNSDPGDNTHAGVSGSSTSTGSFGRLEGDGSGITGLTTADGFDYISASSPVVTTNPSSVGSTWINTTSGEIFVATDITSDENVWQGTAGNTVVPSPEFLGSRGIFGGGTSSDVIEYITISTPGNGTDFGDLTAARSSLAACSNGSRGIFGGGWVSAISNIIDYITIATTGNATDFGDLTISRMALAACSSELRGIFGGGESPNRDTIDYITIATTGNAIDFGDLTSVRRFLAGCSNGVRGLFGGGDNSGNVNTIDYVTIASTGNATDFGDLTSARYTLAATSNDTRGLFAGGYANDTTDTIDYVTIATAGNAADFGDLTAARRYLAGCSDGTYAVFAGSTYYSTDDIMDYVTIASTGNATDFGDLTVARGQLAGCSGN